MQAWRCCLMRKKKIKQLLKSHKQVIDPKLKEKLEVFEDVKRKLIPVAEEFVENAIKNYIFSTLMVLRDELGFGGKRLERVMEKVIFQADRIRDGLVSREDMEKTLKHETGFDFEALIEKY